MSSVGGTISPLNLTSAINSGAAAITTGARQLDRDAQQIANPDAQNSTSSLLDLNKSSLLSQAGVAVIRASNQMLGTLLDAFA